MRLGDGCRRFISVAGPPAVEQPGRRVGSGKVAARLGGIGGELAANGVDETGEVSGLHVAFGIGDGEIDRGAGREAHIVDLGCRDEEDVHDRAGRFRQWPGEVASQRRSNVAVPAQRRRRDGIAQAPIARRGILQCAVMQQCIEFLIEQTFTAHHRRKQAARNAARLESLRLRRL